MTQEQEKAIHLVRKFETAIVEELIGGDKTYKYTAKQCAIICVEEIKSEIANNQVDNSKESQSHMWDRLNYWQQVLTEIEKL